MLPVISLITVRISYSHYSAWRNILDGKKKNYDAGKLAKFKIRPTCRLGRSRSRCHIVILLYRGGKPNPDPCESLDSIVALFNQQFYAKWTSMSCRRVPPDSLLLIGVSNIDFRPHSSTTKEIYSVSWWTSLTTGIIQLNFHSRVCSRVTIGNVSESIFFLHNYYSW